MKNNIINNDCVTIIFKGYHGYGKKREEKWKRKKKKNVGGKKLKERKNGEFLW